jgi:hypothetical protein
MISAIDGIPEARISNASNESLLAEIVTRFRLAVPQIKEDEITVSSPREVQIDVTNDIRYGFDRGFAKGTEVF